MLQSETVTAAGYGPPGGFGPPGAPPPGGYGPPPGGYGGPPPGNFGPPPGGFGGPPGGYGGPPPGGFGGPGGFGLAPPEPAKGLAIGALVCGILAFPGACCCYSSIPLGIAAAVMGGIAMSKAKSSPQTHGGRGLALAGLICGLVALAFSIVVFALHMGTLVTDELQK